MLEKNRKRETLSERFRKEKLTDWSNTARGAEMAEKIERGEDTLLHNFRYLQNADQDTTNLVNSYAKNTDYKKRDSSDVDNTVSHYRDLYRDTKDKLERFRSVYVRAYGEDNVKQMEDFLSGSQSQILSAKDNVKKITDYWNSFKDENDYNNYITAQNKEADYGTLSQMTDDEIMDIYTRNDYDSLKSGDLRVVDDYIKEKGSANLISKYQEHLHNDDYVQTDPLVHSLTFDTVDWFDKTVVPHEEEIEQLEQLKKRRSQQETADKLYNEYSHSSDWNKYVYDTENEVSYDSDDFGNDHIAQTYTYINNKFGEDKAEEYLNSIYNYNNYEKTQQSNIEDERFANEHPILAHFEARGKNLLNALQFTPVLDAVDKVSGYDIDQYDDRHSLTNSANTIDSTLAQNSEKAYGFAGKIVYNAIAGVADTLPGLLSGQAIGKIADVPKLASYISVIINGNNVATQGILDGKNKGYSDTKALALGITQGLLEGITEKFSIDRILSKPTLINSAITEGTEEVTSNWLNKVTEAVVNGDKNEFRKNISQYLKDNPNATQAQALGNAIVDSLKDDGESFLVGALSGAAMGSAVKPLNAASNYLTGKDIQSHDGNVNELVNIGLSYGDNVSESAEALPYVKQKKSPGIVEKGLVKSGLKSNAQIEAHSLASKLQKQISKGNKISKTATSKLRDAIIEVSKEQLVQEQANDLNIAVSHRLKELGGDYNLAPYVTKVLQNEKLTFAERNLIKNNEEVSRVIREFNSQDNSSYKWVDDYNARSAERTFQSEAARNYHTAMFSTTQPISSNIDEKTNKYVSVLPKEQQQARSNVVLQGNSANTVNGNEIDSQKLKVKSVNNGSVTYELENGEIVNSEDIHFTNDYQILNEYAATMPTEEAQAYYSSYKGGDVDEYTVNWNLAKTYGKTGTPEKFNILSLDSDQFMSAYTIGVKSHSADVQKKQSVLDNAVSEFNKNGKTHHRGTVNKEKIQGIKLTARQKASVKAIEKISQVLGVDVELYSSKHKMGVFQGDNGSYDPKTGKIRIDINAGVSEVSKIITDSAMMRTMSHELTHFIKSYSPKMYEELKKLVFEDLEKQGKNINELVESQIEKHNGKISLEKAIDDVVADSCEMMLKDSKAIERIVQKNKPLGEKIKDFIAGFVNTLQKAFKGVNPNSVEAKAIGESIESFKNIQKLWDNALVNAAEAYQATKKSNITNKSNVQEVTQENNSNSENIQEAETTEDDNSLSSTRDVNDREILALALRSVSRDSREYRRFNKYLKNIEKIEEYEERLDEVVAQIKEEKNKPEKERDNSKLNQLYKAFNNLEEMIQKQDSVLVSAEAEKPIRDYIRREKAKARKKVSQNYKQRQLKNQLKKSIRKRVQRLSIKLNTNTKDNNVPDAIKPLVIDLLNAIDINSRRYHKKGVKTQNDMYFDSLKDKYKKLYKTINSYEVKDGILMYNGEEFSKSTNISFTEDMFNELKSLITETQELVDNYKGEETHAIELMDEKQLRRLRDMLIAVSKTITQSGKLLANSRFSTIREIRNKTLDSLNQLPENSEKRTLSDKIGKLLREINTNNLLPYYYFKRMGEGGQAIFESLTNGFDMYAQLSKEIIAFANTTFSNENLPTKWAKEVHTIKLSNGTSFKANTNILMTIYCLSKRPQAKKHLLGGGIKVETFKADKKSYVQEENYLLTEADIETITKAIEGKSKEVADKLQEFMSTTCSEWGNYVSTMRFGINMYNEDIYIPIESDKNNLNNEPKDNSHSVYNLLNKSWTKATSDKANNAIMARDIFDVFIDHATDMAKYRALGLPVLDASRWFYSNRRTELDGGQHKDESVQKAISSIFGEKYVKYFHTFLTDIDEQVDGQRDEKFTSKMLSLAKSAKVGANIRVAMLQPTAYFRAGIVIDAKYLRASLKNPHIKTLIEEMENKTGIGYWKSLGFFDTNTARGIKDIVRNENTLGAQRDKAIEKSMILAEYGDKITWAYLYNACKLECKAKGLKEGTLEFDKAVNNRFNEVIYSSQVVDCVLTRSQIMRSHSGWNKILTAFMSEPTVSYNIFLDTISDVYDQKRSMSSKGKEAAKIILKKSSAKIVRTTISLLLSNLSSAMIEAFFDSLREDDEDTFGDRYLKNFRGSFFDNINPLNQLPVVKDISQTFEKLITGDGFLPTRMDTSYLEYLLDAADSIKDVSNGESTTYNCVYSIAKFLSTISGISISNCMRDATAIWNNTAGELLDYKFVTYEASQKTLALKYGNSIRNGKTKNAANQLERWKNARTDYYKNKTHRKSGKIISYTKCEAEKEAMGDIRDSLINAYADEYREAYIDNDTDTMKEIENILKKSGVCIWNNKTLKQKLKEITEN